MVQRVFSKSIAKLLQNIQTRKDLSWEFYFAQFAE